VRRNRYKTKRSRPGSWLGRLLVALTVTAVAIFLLGASALFVAGYAAVTRSEYFRTQTIAVSGNQRLSEAEILLQAGIRRGDNLLALNLRVVRERLREHPWISEARVSREIPETIAIQIEEHVPLACVDLGRKFLIDAQGRVFKEVAKGDADDLPMVKGIDYADIRLGDDPLGPAMGAVVQALRLSQTADSAIAYADIEQLHLDKEMGVSLTLKQGQRLIKLGFDHYELKYERFKQLLRQLERNESWRAFQSADLNNPERIVVRLAEQESLKEAHGASK
jgi:cell division protein FtsQ